MDFAYLNKMAYVFKELLKNIKDIGFEKFSRIVNFGYIKQFFF